jgi:hypothetical protein
MDAHAQFSAYTLDLPNAPDVFPTFHASELKHFVPNDPALFPSRNHAKPGPIVTPGGVEEYTIEEIIDERHHGRGMHYLVHWQGYGPEEDWWLPQREFNDCQVLDDWLEQCDQ